MTAIAQSLAACAGREPQSSKSSKCVCVCVRVRVRVRACVHTEISRERNKW